MILVTKPGSLWQNGFPVFTTGLTPPVEDSSGMFARTSQLSCTVFPVLTPAWKFKPLAARADMLIRNPL